MKITDSALHVITAAECNEMDRLQAVITPRNGNWPAEKPPQALQIGTVITCNSLSVIGPLDMTVTEEPPQSCRQSNRVTPLLRYLPHTGAVDDWRSRLARQPTRCPRCGSVNIVPDFTVREAWFCGACQRPFCPED
jgi:ribosomal protein S27AE